MENHEIKGRSVEESCSALERKLRDKVVVIGIVGLGYVGLPLAVAFAHAGLEVIGFDIQAERVDMVNRGKSYVSDVSDQTLAFHTGAGRIRATLDRSRLAVVDTICVCVPTPLTKAKNPDLSYIIDVSRELSKYLNGQLVVLESSTYPGTTREVVLPILENFGRKIGRDFHLAYSPERIDPGNESYSIKNTPRLVGGIDEESTRLATILYSYIVEEIYPVSSAEVAEMAKLFENVFRNVNIALVNELALLCESMGISVWEVVEATSSKPFGYMPFYPGPGVGGHCIPVDPYYLAAKAKEYNFTTEFITLATTTNERMPNHIVSRITDVLNNRGKSLSRSRLLVLGVSFKKDMGDTRESPSLKLLQILREKGSEVAYNDPYVPEIEVEGYSLLSVDLIPECLRKADCVIIATDHSSYDYRYIVDNATTVFDARGVTKDITRDNIFRLGEKERK